MSGEVMCAQCPQGASCRYRFGGVGAAEIAQRLMLHRNASALLRDYPELAVEDLRRAVECYAACPERLRTEAASSDPASRAA